MLGAHLENLLFLLLLALAGLFQLLGRAARKTSKGEEEPTSKPAAPIPRAPPQSDEERIRKLMEALGQPAASQPPAPVTPRIDVPPRPLAPVQPPIPQLIPSWKLTPEERRKRPYILKKTPVPGSVTPAEQISTPPIARALEVHEAQLSKKLPTIKTPMQAYAAATRSVAEPAQLKTDLAMLLASTSGLRDAIVLREIFGPPRSLQPLDLL
jgi:hypothetical protein